MVIMRDMKNHVISKFGINYYLDFSTFPGYYLTGDGADRDEDGYYWLTGRIDDVLSISGHRIGTAEIESAIVSHSYVSESAVVPMYVFL